MIIDDNLGIILIMFLILQFLSDSNLLWFENVCNLVQQTVVMARSKGEQLYCLEVSLTFLGHSSHNPPVVSSRRDKKDYSDEKKSDSSYFSWYSL